MTATTRRRRGGAVTARLVAVAVLLLALTGAGAVSTPAASAAACATSSGVTVVVDFGSLGGTSVGCAPASGTGLDVLRAAGHGVGYLPRQPGMVCTIDGRPDPCNGAPVKAYWSYWRAAPGGSWEYSTVGASSTHPKGGSVEGWAFGAGAPPAVRPPARSKPKATAKATTKPKASHSSSSSSSSRTSGSDGGGDSSARPTADTPAARTTPAIAPTTGASSSTATAPAATATPDGPTSAVQSATRTDAAVPTSATSDGGGITGVAVTAALVLLLGAGAGGIAWRRRSGG